MVKDQAQNLREAINRKNKGPKVFCVSSGKGGVGKSNFTLNLGISLCDEGKKVVIIDADIGLANLEILIGVVSKYNLLDILERNMSIEEILIDGPNGIKFISGGSGITQLANVDKLKLDKFIQSISRLGDIADYILIDTGAGISDLLTSFSSISDEVMIVTTCEPTAIADAYALIKVLVSRNINKKINIVINKADNKPEADSVFKNLSTVSKKFVNVDLSYLGYINNDSAVAKAVKVQKPFIKYNENSRASKSIRRITSALLNEQEKNRDFGGFLTRLKNLFK